MPSEEKFKVTKSQKIVSQTTLQKFRISMRRLKYINLLQKHFGMQANLACIYKVRQLKIEVFLQKFT